MHFTSNYSTNGRLHLLLIRRHIILVDKFGLCWFVMFVNVALRPMSTAMVIAVRSVHLTTLFPGQA